MKQIGSTRLVTLLSCILALNLSFCANDGGEETTSSGSTSSSSTSKKTFMTAATFDGNLGGSAGADAKCMADTNYTDQVGGTGTYKAMIADVNRKASITPNIGDGQIDWVLQPSTTYVRPDGTIIMTTGTNGLFDFNGGDQLTNSLDGLSPIYFTGIQPTWVNNTTFHCADWTTNSISNAAVSGSGTEINGLAINENNPICDTMGKLFCVEQ